VFNSTFFRTIIIQVEKDKTKMSDSEECKLKAGHPPAVKAGGMRITQHKSPKEEQPKPSKQDAEEGKTSTSPPKIVTIVSGAVAKGNADFPPEAVQHFHEKPQPTHQNRSVHCTRPIVIQQPRK